MPITDIQEALAALEELRARFDDLADTAADWLWEMDEELRFTHISNDARRFNSGVDPSTSYGKTRGDLVAFDRVDPDDWKRHQDDLTARRPFRNFRYTHVATDGSLHHWSVSGRPVYDSEGAFRGYRGLGRDITERARIEIRLHELNDELQTEIKERRQAEEALRSAHEELETRVKERTAELYEANAALTQEISARKQAAKALEESRDQLRLVTNNLPVAIGYIDIHKQFRFANKTFAEWLARPVEDVIGKSATELLGKEQLKIQSHIDKSIAGEQLSYVESINYPDGVTRNIRATHVPHRGEDGIVEGYFTLVEDISELQQAEEALRHAQKIEVVGQLTGGVAHDFNNLLAVILGNIELLEDEIGENQILATINRAGKRGAELTQRLLAFSRQQALQPQSINLADLISGLHDLLRRTLGEPVRILTRVPDDIWPVFADPGQLESALLNLAINARDAMPNGGVLEIWCSNVKLQEDGILVSDEITADECVQIAVRDTGTGMPEDVLERVFEPFYTTKDVGEGTGLGLSMVYGFARQSGGDVVIESEPGTGTEVKIYLPRSDVAAATEERTQFSDLTRGQGEVILVLEDDPDVRSLAVTILDGLGYRVLEAADATAAMQVLAEEANNIDLPLSDVVLPGGISGPELAARAKDLYPKLKPVFMSGYSADLNINGDIPNFAEAFLTKPFKRADLARVIHETLAS
ncbi:MAG: PAS domain S-box protein [Proteobacteria bacterium]|nr:MAG: PAS domain S-box protein [Pseudomonadota bacterium]